MPFIVWIAPFIPFLAMLPPSLAAVWIANRWFRSRRADAEFREQIAQLRRDHDELQERLDFAERVVTQLRDARQSLPKPRAEPQETRVV